MLLPVRRCGPCQPWHLSCCKTCTAVPSVFSCTCQSVGVICKMLPLQGFLASRRLHSRSHSAEEVHLAEHDDEESLPKVRL